MAKATLLTATEALAKQGLRGIFVPTKIPAFSYIYSTSIKGDLQLKSLLLFITVLYSITLYSQTDSTIQRIRGDNYGNVQNWQEGILDGNNIYTRFNNVGEIGRWPYTPSGEWPKGTGHSYLDGFTFFTAAEVTAPGNNAIVHPLEIYYREWVDKDPVTGTLWTFTPLPGYSNPMQSSPAVSTIKNSWPDTWPKALRLPDDWNGHWYGYFGKDNYYPSQESFFVIDDSKDAEFARSPYNYFPVAEDQNRLGLGLRVEVRTFQWDIPLAADILFTQYDIYNISDFNYEKAISGFYLDPGVGGRDDSGDDNVLYDQENNLIYAFDSDGYGIPNKFKTGYLGVALLETPKNGNEQVGLSSLWVYRLGDGGVVGGWPKDDESIWQKLSSNTFDNSLTNSNISALMGAGPYQLTRSEGGQKHRMASAMIFAQDMSWLLAKKKLAKEAYDNNYTFPDSLQQLNNFSIIINSVGTELKGNVQLTWKLNGNFGKTTTYIYLNDRFFSENLIGVDSLNAGSFSWNTTLIPDGLNYKLVFISFAENGTAVAESGFFNVNNTGKPIIIVTQPENGEDISGAYAVKWLTGNGSGTDKINIYFRPSENVPLEIIARDVMKDDSYNWESGNYTNTSEGRLIVEYISGNDTVTYSVYSLNIYNQRDFYTGEEYFFKRDASGTGSIEILRINSPEITGDNYLVSFRENTQQDTIYDVTNLNTNKLVLSGVYLYDPESPYFEGLRLRVHNDKVDLIDSLTGFENSISNLNMVVNKNNTSRAILSAADYRIDFYNEVQDTGYIESAYQNYRKLPVNLRVTNLASGTKNKIAVRDMDNSYSLSVGDQLQILEFAGLVSVANSRIAWEINFNGPTDLSDPVFPDEGDIFYINTTKPFIPGDSLYFSALKLAGLEPDNIHPDDFILLQNYPNPFNPSTKVKFNIPEQGNVKLTIYDANGQEIKVLVDSNMKSGRHEITFDASTLSSGIYFYVLSFKDQYRSGKMLLLK